MFQRERLALSQRQFSIGILTERTFAKRICHHHAVIPRVPPGPAWIGTRRKNRRPDTATLDRAVIDAPIRDIAPGGFRPLPAIAQRDLSATFFNERSRHPHAEAHFLLVAENQIASGGAQLRLESEKVSVVLTRELLIQLKRPQDLTIRRHQPVRRTQ